MSFRLPAAPNSETPANVTNDDSFNVAAANGKFTVKSAATGTYLASRGGCLYSCKTNTASCNRRRSGEARRCDGFLMK